MCETEQQRKERERQEDLQRLRTLRPIDDDFMRCLFKDNVPLAELVLRIITGKKDLVITDCQTQKDMKRLSGARSICLDAYGVDSENKKYDLEIQRQGSRPTQGTVSFQCNGYREFGCGAGICRITGYLYNIYHRKRFLWERRAGLYCGTDEFDNRKEL